MISGIMIALSGTDPPTEYPEYKTLAAATLSDYNVPHTGISSYLPQNPSLDLVESTTESTETPSEDSIAQATIDSLKNQIELLRSEKTTKKQQKVPAPKLVVKTKRIYVRDTIQVPVHYNNPQVGIKENPTENCISVYEVHKVGEICSENKTSSAEVRE